MDKRNFVNPFEKSYQTLKEQNKERWKVSVLQDDLNKRLCFKRTLI